MKSNLPVKVQTNDENGSFAVKAVILAGGNGTRMKTDIPKILIPVHGMPMIQRLIELLEEISVIQEKIVVCQAQTLELLQTLLPSTTLVIQPKPLGTGHALYCSMQQLTDEDIILVLPADLPCMDKSTIQTILNHYQTVACDILIVGMKVSEPNGYGRIVMKDQQVIKIVEEKEATTAEKDIDIINTSIYVMKVAKIRKILNQLRPNNQAMEYYLTDVVEQYHTKVATSDIQTIIFEEISTLHGANDLETLQHLLHRK